MTLTAWEQCQTDADVITFFFFIFGTAFCTNYKRATQVLCRGEKGIANAYYDL